MHYLRWVSDKTLDLLFFTRPMILIPSWLVLLLGYYRAGSPISRLYPPLPLVHSFFAFSLVMAAVYILNQIFDLESDRINDKVFFLPRGVISIRTAWIEAAVLTITAFVLSYFLGREYLVFISLALLLGVFYSVPPIKLKARPFLDLLANSFGYGLVGFSLGWITWTGFSKLTLLLSLPYIFAIGAVFVNTTIPDIPGDRRTGNRTTAVLLGDKISYFWGLGLLSASLLSGFFLKDIAILIAGFLSLPFFILAAIKRDNRYCLLSTHFGIIALILVTSFFFPYFFVFLLLAILATRFYYNRRFKIGYPEISF